MNLGELDVRTASVSRRCGIALALLISDSLGKKKQRPTRGHAARPTSSLPVEFDSNDSETVKQTNSSDGWIGPSEPKLMLVVFHCCRGWCWCWRMPPMSWVWGTGVNSLLPPPPKKKRTPGGGGEGGRGAGRGGGGNYLPNLTLPNVFLLAYFFIFYFFVIIIIIFVFIFGFTLIFVFFQFFLKFFSFSSFFVDFFSFVF